MKTNGRRDDGLGWKSRTSNRWPCPSIHPSHMSIAFSNMCHKQTNKLQCHSKKTGQPSIYCIIHSKTIDLNTLLTAQRNTKRLLYVQIQSQLSNVKPHNMTRWITTQLNGSLLHAVQPHRTKYMEWTAWVQDSMGSDGGKWLAGCVSTPLRKQSPIWVLLLFITTSWFGWLKYHIYESKTQAPSSAQFFGNAIQTQYQYHTHTVSSPAGQQLRLSGLVGKRGEGNSFIPSSVPLGEMSERVCLFPECIHAQLMYTVCYIKWHIAPCTCFSFLGPYQCFLQTEGCGWISNI